MRTLLTVATLLLFVLTSFAGSNRPPRTRIHPPHVSSGAAMPALGNQTDMPSGAPTNSASPTSNASLSGAYNFELSGPHNDSWGQNLTCGNNNVFMGGQSTRDQSVLGTATFDGAGNVSGSFTLYGKFDSTSSNATVSCASNGNAVYFPPCSGTFSGTYSVQSNGSGTMTFTLGGGCPGSSGSVGFILQLAGACSSGLNNTVYLLSPKGDNSIENTGIARYQSTC